MTQHPRARLAAHAAALLFGLSGLFGALIPASAASITGGRALFAVFTLALLSGLRARLPAWPRVSRGQSLRLLVAGSVLALHWVSFFIAVQTGGVALATLGFASFPAFIALLDGVCYRRLPGRREALLLLLVSAGLLLVAPSWSAPGTGMLGLLWGIVAGFSFALLAILNRQATQGIDAIAAAFWQNAIVMCWLLPWSIGGLTQLNLTDWFFLALLGIFCTGVAHAWFVLSLRWLPAAQVGMIVALEPVYAILAAWLVFAQTPSSRMLAGAALIIGAILLAARAPRSV